jgi:hypothetical protein
MHSPKCGLGPKTTVNPAIFSIPAVNVGLEIILCIENTFTGTQIKADSGAI